MRRILVVIVCLQFGCTADVDGSGPNVDVGETSVEVSDAADLSIQDTHDAPDAPDAPDAHEGDGCDIHAECPRGLSCFFEQNRCVRSNGCGFGGAPFDENLACLFTAKARTGVFTAAECTNASDCDPGFNCILRACTELTDCTVCDAPNECHLGVVCRPEPVVCEEFQDCQPFGDCDTLASTCV